MNSNQWYYERAGTFKCPVCSGEWSSPLQVGARERVCPSCVALLPLLHDQRDLSAFQPRGEAGSEMETVDWD